MNDHDEFEVAVDGYFAILPEWVLDADISDRAVRLYAVLRRYADGQLKARPSRAKLATRLRCSLSSVKRALKELQELGAVTVRQRWANADFTSFSYSKDAGHQTQAANGYLLHSTPRKLGRGATGEPPTQVTSGPPPRSTGEPPRRSRVNRPRGSRMDHELKPVEPEPEVKNPPTPQPDGTIVPLRSPRGGRAIAERLNATAHSVEAHNITRAYAHSSGAPIPGKVLTDIAQRVDECLQSGVSPEQIGRGLTAWHDSTITATSQIPSFVHKAATKPQRTRTKPSDRALAAIDMAEQMIREGLTHG